MDYCPRQILVLGITPCDTVYKSTSLHNFTRVAEKAIHQLKTDLRSVFMHSWPRPAGLDQPPASMLPAGQPQEPPTPSWALTIHATDTAHEALLLRAVLSKHYNLTEGRYSNLNAGSNDTSISSSAVSSMSHATGHATSHATAGARAGSRAEEAMVAVIKAAARAEGVMVAAARAVVGKASPPPSILCPGAHR